MPKRRRIALILSIACAAMAMIGPLVRPKSLHAHPISVTDCFLRVDRDEADAEITIFLEDLYFFQNLAPDERDFLPLKAIREGAEKHQEFLMERFVIRDANGDRLSAEFIKMELPELSPQGVPLAELMSHKVSYRFRYKFEEPPEFLSVSQHLVDELIAVPAEMKLVASQSGSGAAFTTRLNSEAATTMRFDWEGPLVERPTAEQLEAWFAEQREKMLGITSYSSLYAFLYVEDFEVRLEVLAPLAKLDEMRPLKRAKSEFLSVEEQDAHRDQLTKYFESIASLVVDQQETPLAVSRLDYISIGSRDLAQQSERKRVSMVSGRVGAIMSAPLKSPASKIDLTWNGFSDSVYTVQLFFFTEDGFERTTLARLGEARSFHWQREGAPPDPKRVERPKVLLEPRASWSIPWISLACLAGAAIGIWFPASRKPALVVALIGAFCFPITWPIDDPFSPPASVADERAEQVVTALIRKTYSAFRLRDEEATYDELSQTAAGSLRDQLYQQIRRSMVMQQQGGAIATVRNIEPGAGRRENLKRDDERAFRYRLSWSVEGDVEHWGHVHTRANRYDAVFTVEPHDDFWLFTDLELLQEERLPSQTSLRRTAARSASYNSQGQPATDDQP